MADGAASCAEPAGLARRNFAAGLLSLVLLAVVAGCSQDDGKTRQLPDASGFDFYVMSLSWSPSFCEAEGPSANVRQCGAEIPHAFIVHGLWPQFEQGWPEFCNSDEPARVPDDLARSLDDIMPSFGLVGHQWRRHGTCSGLTQQDYFAVVRAARDRIAIPDSFAAVSSPRQVDPEAIEAEFIAANPGLDEGGIAVTCDDTRIREVRICMTTGLTFRSCPEVAARACSLDMAKLPPAAH